MLVLISAVPLGKAVTDVLANAIHYTPAEGSITVDLGVEGEFA